MRAGLFLAYWPWFSLQEQVELAVLGDQLGLDSVWISEAWGHDAVSILGLIAGRTERIGVGSGILQIPARPPTATAMAAVTLDALSDGRFRLGLGVSGPQVSEGWYGVPFARPVARTREYVEIVRAVVARRGPLVHEGREFRIPLAPEDGTGLGKPLKLLARPVRREIPIYLGAIGPKAVAQVGEIADGWLPFMFDPDEPELLLGPLREGAGRAGRSLSDIDIAAAVPVGLSEDLDEARAAVKPLLAFYLGAMGARDKNFYVDHAERAGFGDEAREVQSRWLGRDQVGAVAALPDALVDRMGIATTPAGLDERLAAYEAAGVDTLVCVPCGPDRPAIVRALAAARG